MEAKEVTQKWTNCFILLPVLQIMFRLSVVWPLTFNSSWPSDTIQRHRSVSTLAQIMAWCLKAGSHYLNQCWFLISDILWLSLNPLRPRQNGRHFPDDIFKYIFLDENVRISLKISLKFVPKVPINNIPALVLIMAWRRPGDKPLSEPMMVSLPTHICITRPQWVAGQFHWKW